LDETAKNPSIVRLLGLDLGKCHDGIASRFMHKRRIDKVSWVFYGLQNTKNNFRNLLLFNVLFQDVRRPDRHKIRNSESEMPRAKSHFPPHET
jgi:hypothetical protein